MYIKINNETQYTVRSYTVQFNPSENNRRLILNVVSEAFSGELVGQLVSIYIYETDASYNMFRGFVMSVTGNPDQKQLTIDISEQK